MIELHLVRHADAGDPLTWPGDDADRPLSAKGRRQAARLGALLSAAGFSPDALISSPKLRARQTADAVGSALGVGVAIDARLGGSLDLAIVERILAEAGDPLRPMLVGHDPDLSWLVSELSGTSLQMKKGALARVDVAELGGAPGSLRWLVPPGLLSRR